MPDPIMFPRDERPGFIPASLATQAEIERSAAFTCADHTRPPAGVVDSIEWRMAMNRTHQQALCGGCGRWTIWVPKGPHGLAIQAAKDAHKARRDAATKTFRARIDELDAEYAAALAEDNEQLTAKLARIDAEFAAAAEASDS